MLTHPGGRSESKLKETQRIFNLDSDWIPAAIDIFTVGYWG